MHTLKRLFRRRGSLLLCLGILCCLGFPTSAQAAAANFPILGILHAGNHPEALSVDTQTHMLYIGYEVPGQVVGFDPISGQVRWHLALGDVVTDVQADSSNHRVYAVSTNYRSNQSNLSILNGATGKILVTLRCQMGENAIAFDAHRQIIYVANQDHSSINTFTFLAGWQSGTPQIRSGSLVAGSHPQALGVNSHLGRLYVADDDSHVVSVVDEQSGHILATIPVGDVPLPPLRVDEATGHIYVVCALGQELDVIDGQSNRIIARTPIAPYPEGLAINTATGRIYVADEGDREGRPGRPIKGATITALDGTSFASLGTLEVGHSPDGVEADPALHLFYVALEDDGAVLEVSDSLDLPLKADGSAQKAIAARQTVQWLQQATLITLLVMAATVVTATLRVQLLHWRERGSPRTQPGGVSSRQE